MVKKQVSEVPPVPILPPTSLHETKAPGGVPPVAPTQIPESKKDSWKAKEDTMSKEDWAKKNEVDSTRMILNTVIASPAFAHLAIGKKESEVFEIGERMFHHFLEVFKKSKNA